MRADAPPHPASLYLVVTLCDYELVLLANLITDSYEQSYLASRAASSAETSFLKIPLPRLVIIHTFVGDTSTLNSSNAHPTSGAADTSQVNNTHLTMIPLPCHPVQYLLLMPWPVHILYIVMTYLVAMSN